jgi:general secretion pathway protein D/MSHA biogenesis protein MshL
MNLVPITSELVEPIEYKEFGTLGTIVGLPIVNVREMSTTVRIKDNEMLVIGGLINEIKDNESNFFPLIGKVPVLRYLFGYEEKVNEKRELIILLKPRII